MKKVLAVSTGVVGSLVGSNAMAADYTAEIGAAFADATGNVTAASAGMIALAAILTGVVLVIGLLRR